MTDKELTKIAYNALCMACKWMRENPPGNLDAYTIEQMSCLVGGVDDPEGKKYVSYFLNQAIAEHVNQKTIGA